MTAMLPAEFADLEPFAATWCLATEPERYSRRLASTLAEMQLFYDAITPHAEAAIAHCSGHPLDQLPADAENLLHLVYSMIQVSFPVEAWRQPRVPDTGATAFDCYVEPVP
jgi:hypothetical protein